MTKYDGRWPQPAKYLYQSKIDRKSSLTIGDRFLDVGEVFTNPSYYPDSIVPLMSADR